MSESGSSDSDVDSMRNGEEDETAINVPPGVSANIIATGTNVNVTISGSTFLLTGGGPEEGAAQIGRIIVANNEAEAAVAANTSAPRTSSTGEDDSGNQESIDCIKLSENIRMYRDKKLSSHALVYEGIQLSQVYGSRAVAVKLAISSKESNMEAEMLTRISNHANVVGIIHADVYTNGPVEYIYIVMEKCHPQNLHEYITESREKNIPFNAELSRKFSIQLLEGLHHIHKHGVLHRDLKPHNILFSLDKKSLKIVDFGLSKKLPEDHSQAVLSRDVGSDGYRAPETFKRKNVVQTIDEKSDVFSLGCVTYNIWTNGLHPFGEAVHSRNHNITKNIGLNLDHILISYPDMGREILERMLAHDPLQRPTTEQLLEHPCFKCLDDRVLEAERRRRCEKCISEVSELHDIFQQVTETQVREYFDQTQEEDEDFALLSIIKDSKVFLQIWREEATHCSQTHKRKMELSSAWPRDAIDKRVFFRRIWNKVKQEFCALTEAIFQETAGVDIVIRRFSLVREGKIAIQTEIQNLFLLAGRINETFSGKTQHTQRLAQAICDIIGHNEGFQATSDRRRKLILKDFLSPTATLKNSTASIGIDLGTTYSCVAFYRNGKVEIIHNDLGDRSTPSVVTFTDKERVCGERAKRQMAKYPKNTIYDVKRLMGRKFSDSAAQADMKHWPFAIVNVSGKPKIKVNFKGKDMSFHPEQIGAAVLEKMKSIAEDYIGKRVYSAVITVPAYFNDAQRRATKDAADIAGLHVLGILNEPTAAAIAYGLVRKSSGDRKVLVFDLGGGTFDVTVMEIKEDNIYNVKATGGDSHLGGQDFNNRLYNHCLAEFSRKNKVDFTVSERAKQRLREECENTKRLLSSARRASMRVDSLFNDTDLDIDISRAEFEQLCEDLFRGTIETVEKVLTDAEFRKDEIDDVVLVGGSTRIPCLQKRLTEYFGDGKICKTINPDEAVAAGAAVRAAFLSDDVTAQMEDMKLHDVIPLSLGVETIGKIMTVVVPKNTRIPTQKYHTFETTRDDQVSIEYPVFEGERSITTQNNLLGSFTLSGLPSLPVGEAKTEVCFNIDDNGVLSVSARDMSNAENKANVEIAWDKGRFSKKVLEEMYEEARKFRKEDEKKRQTVTARNDLEALVNKARRIVRQSDRGSDSQRYSLSNKCKFMTKWLDENPEATKSDISAKHSELEAAIHDSQG